MSRVEDWKSNTQRVLKDIEEYKEDDDAIYLLEPIAVVLDTSSPIVATIIPWLAPVFKILSSILRYYSKKKLV